MRVSGWFLWIFCALSLAVNAGVKNAGWLVSSNNETRELKPNKAGTVQTEIKFPGSALIYCRKNRRTMRAKLKDFQSKLLSIEVKIDSKSNEPVNGNFFVKDKDGYWFQSRKTLNITPGEWTQVGVRLPAAYRDLSPIGHYATWDSLFAVSIHTIGLSLYGSKKRDFTISCRNPELTGTRKQPQLEIIDLKVPDTCERYQMLQGTFGLSREYFNPFDPEEIQIDVEAEAPDGSHKIWPAFFTRNYNRKQHFTREINTPTGKPYWAFRFTPAQTGKHKLRLLITDNSTKKQVKLTSPWREITVKPSKRKGFVRVHDKRYMAHESGEFFYPVGMNIHTNIDLRSENSFKFGHLADRGVYDYMDYFDAMSANGMNACEVWMASWTFALEWTSEIAGYYGMGRYNLANASRLDFVLDYAAQKGINIFLVLDNHGKLSAHSDQEWVHCPLNKKTPFAVADGGMLDKPNEYFTNETAIKYTKVRNRYIAARWGAYTNIMGIELWSEEDLITDFKETYNDDRAVKWQKIIIDDFKKNSFGKQLMTTHFCSTYNRNFEYSKIQSQPEIDIVVGDAYRSTRIPFHEHLSVHGNAMTWFNKPVLITEFGGTSQGSDASRVVGDIHCALWASMLKNQAGAPFLWWHDFIHRNNHYRHYKGYSKFIRDINPLNRNFVSRDLKVVTDSQLKNPAIYATYMSGTEKFAEYHHDWYANLPTMRTKLALGAIKFNSILDPESPKALFQCYSMGNASEVYGWIFFSPLVYDYPGYDEKLQKFKHLNLILDYPLAGNYEMEFFDTITGKPIEKVPVSATQKSHKIAVKLPPFCIDLAFKLRRKF